MGAILMKIGSFLEFLALLHLFQQEYTPATMPYHLIVPSLPGYTFSTGPPLDQNYTSSDVARIVDKLMKDLGFERATWPRGVILGVESRGCWEWISRVARVRHPSVPCPILTGIAVHCEFDFPEFDI